MAEPLEYPVSAPGFDAFLDQMKLLETYAKAADAAMAKISPIFKMAADGAKALQQQTEVLVASMAKQSDADKRRVKEAEATIKGFEAMGRAAENQAMREEKARQKEWEAAERAAEKESIAAAKAAQAIESARLREQKAIESAAAKQIEAAERAAIAVSKASEKQAAQSAKAAKTSEEQAAALEKMASQAEMAAKRLGLQGEAAAHAVKIGTQYASILRETGSAQSELMSAWIKGLSPAENTARALVTLSAKSKDATIASHAAANAVGELTAKFEDQYRRQLTNIGGQNKLSRSLSELKDEMQEGIMRMLPFGNHLVNITQRFYGIQKAAKDTAPPVRDIAREYAEAGSKLKFVDGNAVKAASSMGLLGGVFSALLSPVTLVIGAIAAVGVGLGVAGVHAGPFIRDMRDLENTLGLVGDQSAKAREQMAALQAKALSASELGIGPREAADAMGQLASLGLNAVDTLKAFEPVALLAKARGLDMGTAAKIAGANMAIFGTNVDALGAQLDKLSIISNMTGIQAGDLSELMAKAGKGAVAAGQDFDSIAIAAGLARNAAVPMEVAMTGVGSGLLHMASRGRDAFKTLTGGQDVIDTTTGKFRPLESILLDVAKATEKMDGAEKSARIQKIFGQEALTALLPIMAQFEHGIKNQADELVKGADASIYMRTHLDELGNANRKFADNLADSLPGQQEKFKALIDSIETDIGTKIEPALRSLYKVANGVLETMNWIFAPAETVDPLRAKLDAKIKQLQELEKANQVAFRSKFNEAEQDAKYETQLKVLLADLAAVRKEIQEKTKATAASTAATAAQVKYDKEAQDALHQKELQAAEDKKKAKEAMIESIRQHKEMIKNVTDFAEKSGAAYEGRLRSIAESTLPPLEKATNDYNDRLEDLRLALHDGAIGFGAFQRASKEAKDKLDDATPSIIATRKEAKELDDMIKNMKPLKFDVTDDTEAFVTRLNRVRDAVSSVFGSISGTISSVTGMLSGMYGSIGNIVQSLTGTPLMDWFAMGPGAGAALSEALGAVDLSAMIDNLATGIIGALGAMAENMGPLIEGLVGGLRGAIPAIGEALGEAIPQIFGTMLSALPGMMGTLLPVLLGVVTGLIDALLAQLPEMMPALVDMAVGFVVAIIQALPSLIVSLIRYLPEMAVQLIMAIIENLPTLIVAIVEAIPMIIEALVMGLGSLLLSIIASAFDALGLKKQADQLQESADMMMSGVTGDTSTSSYNQNTKNTGGAASVKAAGAYEVSDAYLGVSGSPRLIRDTPGDVTQSYQAGGPNDPAVHQRQGNAIASGILGVLQEMLQLMRSGKAESTGSTSGGRSAGVSMSGARMIA